MGVLLTMFRKGKGDRVRCLFASFALVLVIVLVIDRLDPPSRYNPSISTP
jgi:uncharacterized membrane protein YqjE